MTVGEKIEYLRKSLKITQEELAILLGTTKQTIYKYEKGIVTNIPLDKIEKLASRFGVTPCYLVGWDEEKTELQKEMEQNFIKITSRDGSFLEKHLTDEQIRALKTLIDQMPDVMEESNL